MLRFRQLGANLIPQCYYYLRFFKLILTTIRNLVHSFTSTFSVEWMIEVLEFPVSAHVVSCWLSIDEGSSCSMYETDYHSSFCPPKRVVILPGASVTVLLMNSTLGGLRASTLELFKAADGSHLANRFFWMCLGLVDDVPFPRVGWMMKSRCRGRMSRK